MIEMRWVDGTEKVLQYRQKIDKADYTDFKTLPHPRIVKEWSDWIDIPTIKLGDKNGII